MEDSEIRAIIADERRALADVVEPLSDDQAKLPSLCGEWTVQQVAGHLTAGFHIGLGKFMAAMIRNRGNFDKVNHAFGVQLGTRSVEEIAADLRENATHPFAPPGIGPAAPLGDVLVHGQDIRMPCGISYSPNPEHVVPVLALGTTKKAKALGVAPRIAGLRLETTDVAWSGGAGAEVRGPALAMVMAMFGRPIALDQLDGPGVEQFRRQL